jgi:myo-inositol-1(or 4)-monophosphatase
MTTSHTPQVAALIDDALALAKELALKAGVCMREFRASGAFEVSLKKPLDLVTTADLECDRIIKEGIAERFPGHLIFSEEGSPDTAPKLVSSGCTWIIDPIDGTVNFASGHPSVGVSIGFAIDGKVEAGVVYAPFYNELFSARRGQGSFLNDKRMQCRDRTDLKRSLVATGFPADRSELKKLIHRVELVLSTCQDIRRLGAASVDVAWIAAGRHEAYYESVHPWDIAAAGLIAREAGVRTGVIMGSERNRGLPEDLWCGEYIAAVPGIYGQLQQLLRDS